MPDHGAPIGTFGNFVTPRLSTGGALGGPADIELLAAAGITHVIDCRAEFDDGSLLAQRFHYLYDPTADDGLTKPPVWFQTGIEFGLQALSQPGNHVYAHCAAGVNRGPSMCYAIMRALGWSAVDAANSIKSARPQALIHYSADADAAVVSLGYA
ncbi:MAG TPA: dual specificity protein phosphatase [Candidatus Sulfotelmatobacter sp.]|nr:dual specificity protein phosphatase [Candidatus Sulfotelmatobacter sp.]